MKYGTKKRRPNQRGTMIYPFWRIKVKKGLKHISVIISLVAIASIISLVFTPAIAADISKAPDLKSPPSGTTTDNPMITFGWYNVKDAQEYLLQVDINSDFSLPEIETYTNESKFTPRIPLSDNTYYWRVKVIDKTNNESDWSLVWNITIYTTGVVTKAQKDLGIQPVVQHKDTRMLCLGGCPLIGLDRWDVDHMRRRNEHDDTYCSRASISVVNNYFGGHLSQDRISYQAYGGGSPENDLNHGEGLWPHENNVFRWALNDATIPQQMGKPTFEEIKGWIDASRPILTIIPVNGGFHAVVIDGYHEDLWGLIDWVHVVDPWIGIESSFWYATYSFERVYIPESGAGARSDEASLSQDSDGDGVVDFDEINRFKTDPNKADSDGDGVPDKAEIRCYTFLSDDSFDAFDIRKPDPDGDGLRAELDEDSDNGGVIDGDEDLNGNGRVDPDETDPLNAADDITLSITTPTQSSTASAGAYDNPSHIDVTVEVKEGTTPVTGLTNADFTFKIGGKSATASLTDTSILGRYVFDLTPPKQDAAGKYDLEVSVQYSGSTFEDKKEAAVIYTAGGHADVMLIIDRSGSMGGSAIADARNSAKLFVDYMRDDDYAGVVSFASSASYNYHLTPLTAAIKIAIKNAIDGISAGGSTAMGDGLRYGLNDFINLGDPTHAWAMVLLSDGYHNTGEDPNNVLPDIKALDIRVFTIGLGPSVDKALLEHIATETDGEYYYAATSDQLREIYDYIVGRVVGWQTVLKRYALIFMGEVKQIFVSIGSSVKEALFSISWGGSDLDLVLYKPDGTKIDPAVAATDPKIEYVKEATYAFYRVIDPDPGEWTMEVTAIDVPSEGEEFTATAKVISTLTMYLTTDKDQYYQGEVIKTIASITEGGLPITGAAVNADITLPYGSTESLALYDDGGHGDIAPNDGVYANYLTNTEQIGNYKIDASATGTASSGEPFSRQAETTVEVVPGQSLINVTPDIWSETVSPGGQVKTTFTVNDPAAIGELFMINEYLHAEYNGTHYSVYNESSIGGEPDYIIPTSPSRKALAASPVSKWVSLTATSLQTPTGDIIDVSNVLLSSDVLEVPLGGSNDFNATINISLDAPIGIYSGKIVATAIGGSDSVDVEITVINNPPVANANGPYTGVIEYIAVPITFDGTGSYDPDGTIISYAWDLDNDGKFDDAVGATPTVSFTAPCLGNIHLKVTDNNGATDTDTTTLTITKQSPPPNGIHGGLLTPPEQPQCYKGTSAIQGKGYFSINERIQDWATAIDTTEHMEGTGEFEMDSKRVLNQAANPLDFYNPNFYYKKTMQFQGNATNRLISRDKFESSGIFGGTGTRINEYFDVSMIQKDESGSIKTIAAPGSGQSHRFATMDDFSGIWGIHSDWQKICQKEIVHHQMFKGNFSVQKDLTFEREIVMP